MQNADGENVDLYIPRKWYANTLLPALIVNSDHLGGGILAYISDDRNVSTKPIF